MRRYSVEFLRPAEEDLFNLYETIAAQAGIVIAGNYVDRIESACLALQTSPLRGTKRDDISSGLRTIGFERRATIVFHVRGSRVTIVRVFYGRQDFEHKLRNQ